MDRRKGERKQVTALFADVTGSLELAEQLDPHEWHAILDRLLRIFTHGVHRFGRRWTGARGRLTSPTHWCNTACNTEPA